MKIMLKYVEIMGYWKLWRLIKRSLTKIKKRDLHAARFKVVEEAFDQGGEISIMILPATEATLSNHTHAFIISEVIKQLVRSGANSSKTHIYPFEIK